MRARQPTPGIVAPTLAHALAAFSKAGSWGLNPAGRLIPTPSPCGPKNGSGKLGTPWVRMQCAFATNASFWASESGAGRTERANDRHAFGAVSNAGPLSLHRDLEFGCDLPSAGFSRSLPRVPATGPSLTRQPGTHDAGDRAGPPDAASAALPRRTCQASPCARLWTPASPAIMPATEGEGCRPARQARECRFGAWLAPAISVLVRNWRRSTRRERPSKPRPRPPSPPDGCSSPGTRSGEPARSSRSLRDRHR